MPKMENVAKTLYNFFNSLMPSYLENYVPVGIEFPYLTYQLIQGNTLQPELIQIRIYTKSESLIELVSYIDNINETIEEGLNIPILNEENKMWIYKGNPFSQFVSEEDKTIKSGLINLNIQMV